MDRNRSGGHGAHRHSLKLVILASDPQGNGITKAYSKAAAFDDPITPVTTAISLKAKYDAKYGAPSAVLSNG